MLHEQNTCVQSNPQPVAETDEVFNMSYDVELLETLIDEVEGSLSNPIDPYEQRQADYLHHGHRQTLIHLLWLAQEKVKTLKKRVATEIARSVEVAPPIVARPIRSTVANRVVRRRSTKKGGAR